MSAGIDSVLQAAVDGGVVPQVVAMAADEGGAIYEGAAGPRAVGEDDAVDARHAVPDRLDDEDGLAPSRRCSRSSAATWTSTRRSSSTGPSSPTCRCSRASTATSRVCAAGDARPRCASSRATPAASPTGSGARTSSATRRSPAPGTRCAGKREMFTPPLVADPGLAVRVRHQHRLARARRRGRQRPVARRLLRRAHPRPAGDDPDDVPDEPPSSAPTRCRCTCAASPARGRRPTSTGRRSRSGSPAATASTRRRATTSSSSACCWAAARSRARKILETASLDEAFTNQIGELDFPPAIATADPSSSADFNAGPGYKFGLGLLLNSEDQPGARKAGSGAWAGIFNTHFWVDRSTGVTGAIYAQTLPFVEPPVFQMYADFERALYASLDQGTVRTGASSATRRRSRRRPRAAARSAAARGPARRACRPRA